jgi:FKBP-type peptidyl-prolyl cis-trans isomerase FklB
MMKNNYLCWASVVILAGALGVETAVAADPPATPPAQAPQLPPPSKENASYGIGMTFGNQLKRAGFEVDLEAIVTAMKDVMAGRETKMNEQQAREAIMAYQQDYRKKLAEKNKLAGEEYLAANKKKEGVKTHTVTLPDGKTAELQYKVLKEGSGTKPTTNDTVTVNYRGTTIDGKEFDSSAKRGQPAKFPVTRVVKGWTEALQLMPVGSKWEIYLPSTLAYGDMGSGPVIEPGAALVFEVELVSAEPQPAPQAATPAPSQPLTSDIIRVPSADEMKKGAKIEVIKQEDLDKKVKEEQQKKKEEKK